MIQTVENIYGLDGVHNGYRIIYENGVQSQVPLDEANRHYQEILEWVENGGVIVDNGA